MEEGPKYLYQSGSEAEDTAQRIESLTQTRARVLREKLGRKVASKSVASSRPHRQVVPSQSEKRDDGHGTRSRVKGKEYDGPEPRWVTRASLDRTVEKPLRRPAKDGQWQRDGFTMLLSVPWDTDGLTVESMARNRRKHVTESSIQDEAPGGPVHLEVSLREMTKCQRKCELPMSPNVIGGSPAVRRVVKGSGSAGDEAARGTIRNAS